VTCIVASLPRPRRGLNEADGTTDKTGMGSDELTRRLRAQVESVLDRLRPGLVVDGGNVELVGVDEGGAVSVLFQGACAQCPAQLATLRFAIEATLRREVPAVTEVVPVEPRGH
jgi:Fe-S cluster biogenesis protein NfuA